MSFVSSNMGLKVWDQPNDIFSYVDLATNFGLLDQHDHSGGKGVQINTGGIANLAVDVTKVADNAISTNKLQANAVTNAKIGVASVGESNLTTSLSAKVTPPLVTSLPSSPFDGQECYFQADATNGVIWHLRYRAASASARKWELVGGPGLYKTVATAETCAADFTWRYLATPGPTITLPLAGDYDVEMGAGISNTNNTTMSQARLALDVQGSLAPSIVSPFISLGINAAGGLLNDETTYRYRAQGLSATTYSIAYQAGPGGGPVTYADRRIYLTPIRVG